METISFADDIFMNNSGMAKKVIDKISVETRRLIDLNDAGEKHNPSSIMVYNDCTVVSSFFEDNIRLIFLTGELTIVNEDLFG